MPPQGRIRLLELLERVVDRPAVVARQQEVAQHFRMPQLGQHLAHGEEVAERLRHLLVVDVDEAVVHPEVRRTGRRWRRRTARSRSRGAGTSDPCRRRGCRSACPAAPPTSPSTRCASRGGPAPTANPTTARLAWRASRARSRAGRAWTRRPRRARRRAGPRGACPRACRSRRTSRPHTSRRRSAATYA